MKEHLVNLFHYINKAEMEQFLTSLGFEVKELYFTEYQRGYKVETGWYYNGRVMSFDEMAEMIVNSIEGKQKQPDIQTLCSLLYCF